MTLVADGTAAADVVFQDARCVVIRDANPQAPTHVLVMPREHLESLDDASQKDELLLGHLLRVAAKLVADVIQGASLEERTDQGLIKEKIRKDLKKFIFKQTSKRPFILPVIMEI